ncbi:MAG: 3-dehydroquinate synthase, partial [Spirochaetia bacterium]|nr:3-dehydroquinate synthase [Spirochaetia bacterium]
GEVLKAGFIKSRPLANFLASNRDAVLKRETKALSHIIKASLEVKRDVVGKDEKETGGLRRILNYGHTIGHAVELLARFHISHGFCVAIGMSAEARLAVRLGILKDSARIEMDQLIASYGLPLAIPKNLKPSALADAMLLDKKSTDGKIQFSLCSEIGRMESAGGTYSVSAPKKLILEILRDAQS